MRLYKRGAIGRLRKARFKAAHYFAERLSEEELAKEYGVFSNTFRALTGYQYSPSKIYRAWAKRQVGSDEFRRSVRALRGYKGYVEFHHYLHRNLARHWRRHQGKPLSLAHTNKLVDLFMKRVARTEFDGEPGLTERLVSLVHVPLDLFSLLAVRENFHGIVISEHPSMGDIDSSETYNFIQAQIRELMHDARLPVLYFDFYAWNRTHSADGLRVKLQ